MDKIYAIGMGEWVEIRSSSKIPKKVGSKVKLKIKSTKKIYDEILDKYVAPPNFRIFEVYVFNGGSVLGCIKLNKFFQMTKIIMRKDTIIEVPQNLIPQIKEFF